MRTKVIPVPPEPENALRRRSTDDHGVPVFYVGRAVTGQDLFLALGRKPKPLHRELARE